MATARTALKTVSAQISQKSVGHGLPGREGAPDALRAVRAEEEHEDAEQAVAGAEHAERDVVDVDERRQQPADGERQAESTERRAQPGQIRALGREPGTARRRVASAPRPLSVVHSIPSILDPRPGSTVYVGSPLWGEARGPGRPRSLVCHRHSPREADTAERGGHDEHLHDPPAREASRRDRVDARITRRSRRSRSVIAAVVAGALIGILFSVIVHRQRPRRTQHRAGGHHARRRPRPSVASAAVATERRRAHRDRRHDRPTRSPARGGFAVGRTQGAGSGFIVDQTGTRAPARGASPAASLGAGHDRRERRAGRRRRRLERRPQAPSERRYAETAASPPSSTSRALA